MKLKIKLQSFNEYEIERERLIEKVYKELNLHEKLSERWSILSFNPNCIQVRFL